MNNTLSYNYQFTMDTYFNQFFEGAKCPLCQDLDLFWRNFYVQYPTLFWPVFSYFIYFLLSTLVRQVYYMLALNKRKTEQEILNEEIAEQLMEISDRIYQWRRKMTKNTTNIHKNTTNINEMDEDVRVLERIYHNKRRKINYSPNLEESGEEDFDEEEFDEEESDEYENDDNKEGIRLRSGRIITKRKSV
jgi:hypothetical protein